MKMKLMGSKLSYIFCFVLIVAMALVTNGCNKKATNDNAAVGTEAAQENGGAGETNLDPENEPEVLGQGNTVFYFHVTDPEGMESYFEIHTDHTIVGDALQELGLIDGEEGEFGLYVKTVNGVTVDYDTSGMYWAFYEGEEFATVGVDATEITEGASYSFKAQE